MKKIDEFIKHNPKYRKLQKPLQAAEVCEAARALAHGHYDVISFKGGLLTLGVSSSSQAANLQMESGKIISDINKKLGKEMVERIRFRIT